MARATRQRWGPQFRAHPNAREGSSGMKRVLIAVVAMIICVGVVVGLVSGAFAALAEGGLYASGLWSRNGPSTLAPSLSSSVPATTVQPTPTASPSTTAAAPTPVLVPAPTGPPPDAARLAARIAGVRVADAKGNYSAAVVDVGTGTTLFRHQDGQGRIPASTLKLLTSGAALSRLGPDHTFRTRVVSPRAGEIVLVGGGDPYLAAKSIPGEFPRRASVNDLAKRTAAALAKRKIKTVHLGYDGSLFSGPAWNPAWPSAYRDQVTPVSALWIDEGRVGGSPGPRVKDPSREAATVFAAGLRRNGVGVTGIRATKVARSAAEVAAVSSPPLARIVEKLLMASDNDAAEVLSRQVAVGAGRPGSTAEGVKAVRA
ncbi:MAG TPA: D-alanyl-D-alanine carboxypeptidase, partial [Propionibacteriaceae bacterium]|nr:D-alanyl-D-alanine carboxypeptidase [Propionibacteriaceae bacterium]